MEVERPLNTHCRYLAALLNVLPKWPDRMIDRLPDLSVDRGRQLAEVLMPLSEKKNRKISNLVQPLPLFCRIFPGSVHEPNH